MAKRVRGEDGKLYKVKKTLLQKGMVLDFSGNSSCCSWRISWG